LASVTIRTIRYLTGSAMVGEDPSDGDRCGSDEPTRLALAVLREELARATAEALARGVRPEAVADYLAARTDRLRASLPREDVADDAGDPGQLGPVGE
jgi:hypothetical protein